MYLDVPGLNEIFNSIHSLKTNKAVSFDNIPPLFLKIASKIFTPCLHYFIEFSLTNGLFPDSLTIAKVSLLFKKGDHTNPVNYCPISVLTFQKILKN